MKRKMERKRTSKLKTEDGAEYEVLSTGYSVLLRNPEPRNPQPTAGKPAR